MYRIGWFSTGRGKGSRDLLTAAQDSMRSGDLKASIDFVFCSREPGEAEGSDLYVELVKSYGIPLVYFSSRRFLPQLKSQSRPAWRLEYDREVMKRIEGFAPDLCVLAGYMLVVGGEMCRKYKMINLHPALPNGPAGTWQEVIWQLIEDRTGSTGAMMHLVTPELDKGPPVTFHSFSIRGEPFDRHWRAIEGLSVDQVQSKQGDNNALFGLIREHGMVRESPLVVATIKAFSEGRVRIEEGRVLDASGEPITAYDLTTDIEEIVRRRAAGKASL